MVSRKVAALIVLAIIAAVVVFVVTVNIDTWRHRANPTMVNEGPTAGPMQPHPPAP